MTQCCKLLRRVAVSYILYIVVAAGQSNLQLGSLEQALHIKPLKTWWVTPTKEISEESLTKHPNLLSGLLLTLSVPRPRSSAMMRGKKILRGQQHVETTLGRTKGRQGRPIALMRSPTAPLVDNGEKLKEFLLGQWSFNKTLDYKIGGSKGIMIGEATFTETPELRTALLYEERGQVYLEGFQRPFEAYRKYLFNTAKWPIEVYFVDDVTKKHLKSLLPELEYHTSFFIPLPFDTSEKHSDLFPSHGKDAEAAKCAFEHLCVDDLYSGIFQIRGSERFDWRWTVKGPNKNGDIRGVYARSRLAK